MKRVLLSPVSMLLGAVITMLTLVLALDRGEAAAIAAYSVGVSVGALVAVVSGGGSTLAFITGDLETQRSARALRAKLVAPAVVVATVIVAWVYGTSTGLSVPAILFGGATVLVNTANELDTAYLNRRLATVTVMIFDLSSRVVGVVVLLTVGSFALAMLSAGVSRFVFLLFSSRADPSRHGVWRVPLAGAWRRASQPSLVGASLAYAIIDRLLFFVIPFVASNVVAGYAASMLSAQQAVSGAVSAGLRTLMGARSESRVTSSGADLSWGRRVEIILVALAFVGAGVGIAFAGFFLGVLSIPDDQLMRTVWILVLAAMPFAVLGRAIQYHLIEGGASARALVMLLVVVGVQAVVALVAVWGTNLPLLTAALIASELAGILWATLGAGRSALRRRRP